VAKEQCATADYRAVEVEVAVEVAVKPEVDADTDTDTDTEAESGCWFAKIRLSIRAAGVFIRVALVDSANPASHLCLSHM
jgi:hypothetical protein